MYNLLKRGGSILTSDKRKLFKRNKSSRMSNQQIEEEIQIKVLRNVSRMMETKMLSRLSPMAKHMSEDSYEGLNIPDFVKNLFTIGEEYGRKLNEISEYYDIMNVSKAKIITTKDVDFDDQEILKYIYYDIKLYEFVIDYFSPVFESQKELIKNRLASFQTENEAFQTKFSRTIIKVCKKWLLKLYH